MSPYIITTTHTGDPETQASAHERIAAETGSKRALAAAEACRDGSIYVSRRAVATLDEAREAAKRIVEDADYPTGAEAQAAMAGDAARCEALSESGGAVVLPEGTVIEVEEASWNELASIARSVPQHDYPNPEFKRILGEYNAAQD